MCRRDCRMHNTGRTSATTHDGININILTRYHRRRISARRSHDNGIPLQTFIVKVPTTKTARLPLPITYLLADLPPHWHHKNHVRDDQIARTNLAIKKNKKYKLTDPVDLTERHQRS